MNEEMYTILESCLQELDNGVEMETILARYPKFAAELRPILNASLQVKQMPAPAPSQAAIVRGRARLMQKVAETREGKIAPRKRVIPFFQRIAISFTLAATLLLSGTGLVGASSSALPGQKLYPVKRGWEDVRLFFTFNEENRDSLEREFEDERLHEVTELLSEDEHSLVDFYGTFTIRNGVDYVAEVKVKFPDGAQRPNEGMTLHIVGATEHDHVEVTSFEIIQDIFIVPNIIPTITPNDAGAENNPLLPSSTNEDLKPADPTESANGNESSDLNQTTGEGDQNTTMNENEIMPTGDMNNNEITPTSDMNNNDGTQTNEDQPKNNEYPETGDN